MNDADSTLARLELFTDAYAKVMETWSPEKPIVWSNEEE
jgi:hypothetical protein